ncbi:MAG: tetratricopeptide repeat protein [Thermoplasmata archaeon]
MNQAIEGIPSSQKGKGSELLERANQAYDAGQYELALELFNAATSNGAESEVIYNNKGAALDALQRNSEARECYTKATMMNPMYELAWHNLGSSLFIQDMFSEASRAYSKAASLKPDRKENWSGLAASLTKVNKRKRAKSAIEKLDRFADKDPSVLLLQADLYLDAGFTEQAMKRSSEFISKRKDSAEGYAHLGNAEHELGDYGEAIATFEKALEIAPNDKELWNNLGYTCFVAGYLDRALSSFDKALAIDPNYKHAWYNKGYAYHGADLLEQAVDCYRKALSIDPHDRVLWNNLGNALYNLGKYADSIPKFVEAITVDPDYEIAWNNIGNALEKMSMFNEAVSYHDRSLDISPDFDYALFAKGVCRSMMGDLEGGYDLVLESLDLNPHYDEAWKARASIAGKLGRWDEALIAIEEALAINPEFDQGWTERGEILLRVGNAEASQASFEMALTCLQEVSLDTVSGVSALMRRGELMSRLGKFDEALANLESAVLSTKVDSAGIPKVLELRRFLNRWELPKSIRDIAEKSPDIKVRLSYAGFLLDAGDAQAVESILSNTSSVDANGNRDVQLLRARALAVQGKLDQALEIAASLEEGGFDYHSSRFEGEIREAKGDLDGAEMAYEHALAHVPSDLAAATALARVQLKLNKPESAIASADLAVGIDSRDWVPHKIKSDALKSIGEDAKAAQELAEARARLFSSGVRSDEWLSGEAS